MPALEKSMGWSAKCQTCARSSASMPRSALGDKDRGSRRDKDWAARSPGNIKSKPTNPAILTTYEGMHYDAVSSITAMIVVSCSRAVRDLLASKTCDMRRSIGVSVDGVESATTLTVRPIGSHASLRGHRAPRGMGPIHYAVLQPCDEPI